MDLLLPQAWGGRCFINSVLSVIRPMQCVGADEHQLCTSGKGGSAAPFEGVLCRVPCHTGVHVCNPWAARARALCLLGSEGFLHQEIKPIASHLLSSPFSPFPLSGFGCPCPYLSFVEDELYW